MIYLVIHGQLLEEWDKFMGDKFAKPDADNNRSLDCLMAEDEDLSDEELTTCLEALRSGQATGWDNSRGILCINGSINITLPDLSHRVAERSHPRGAGTGYVYYAAQEGERGKTTVTIVLYVYCATRTSCC